MDDHRLSLKDYQDALTGRWAGTALVAILALAVVGIGWFTTEGWNSRFNRVFEPLPGLVYAPPEADLSLTTADAPIPLSFQSIGQDDAYRYNASIPIDPSGLEAATPFVLPANLAPADRARALNCLTQAVYYEAASESAQGQRAVAQVILNRMRHPAFPSSVCGVVYSGSQRTTGCQFTFTCDGALARAPSAAGWARARGVAMAALGGYVETSVGHATHYHTLWVAPYWSPSLLKIANIGAHTFYRWKGLNGKKPAFTNAYRGSEPVVFGRMTPPTTAEPETPAEIMIAAESGAATSVALPTDLPSINLPEPTLPGPAVVVAPVAAAPSPEPSRAAPAAVQANAAPAEQRSRRRVARAEW